MQQFDVAIVGSGFGGSLLAMIARRLGLSVILLEKGRHPRFAIGESSTPLCNLLLEQLATRYDLPRLLPLCKWGAWQREYPAIGCGLKRGFTFYGHEWGQNYAPKKDRSNQLLVAASPHDGLADTHWYRPDFDHFFVQEAQQLGVDYRDNVQLENVEWTQNGAILSGVRENEALEIEARFVIDAGGANGFLARQLNLPSRELPAMPKTQTVFAHFSGVKNAAEWSIAAGETPPYPPDASATHHVFDGGWMWVLPFNNGITSAGFAARDDIAQRFDFEHKERAWQRILQQLPSVQQQFADARNVTDFYHVPRISFALEQVVGPRWALLPSAAGFVDPLLSTGFVLTLFGISRLAEIFAAGLDVPDLSAQLSRYETQTRAELDWVTEIVGALYATMGDFPKFSALSLLYFAAASFSETARRLEKPHLTGGFLMHDHPVFGLRARQILQMAHDQTVSAAQLRTEVLRAIEPFDVAGLRREQGNWYGVEARDLFAGAHKVEADASEIETMLQRCGFYG